MANRSELSNAQLTTALSELMGQLDVLTRRNDNQRDEIQEANERAAAAETAIQGLRQAAEDAATAARGSQAAAVNAVQAAQNAQAVAAGHPFGHGGGGGGGGGGFPVRRETPKQFPITFSNTREEDWTIFKHNFKVMARLQGLSEDHKKWMLQACLRGEASRVMMWQDHEGTETFEELLTIYETKFLPPSASDTAKVKYEATRQLPKEDLVHYSSRLLANFQRAYPDQVNIVTEVDSALVRAFVRGLNSREEAKHVARTTPHNYNTALDAALKEHSVQTASFNYQHYHTGGARGGAEPMDIGSIEWMEEELQISAMSGNPPRCYYCQQFGHTRNQCPAYKRHLANGGKPQKGPGYAGASQGAGQNFKKFSKSAGGDKQDRPKQPAGGQRQEGRHDFRRKKMAALISEMNALQAEDEGEGEEEEEDPPQGNEGGEDGNPGDHQPEGFSS